MLPAGQDERTAAPAEPPNMRQQNQVEDVWHAAALGLVLASVAWILTSASVLTITLF